ncbi:MAG: glycosyltransferase family 39 protein [Opitutae bacterium]|nr:glycosyltransferase family 39 protein [Opitutae bacterium]
MTFRRSLLPAMLALAAFAVMAGDAARRIGITFDEPAHVAAGRAYWLTGDYRLQPENGLLPQRLEGLPAQLAGMPFPAPSGPTLERADVWGIAREYLFDAGVDANRIVFPARLVTVGLGVLLLALMWRWSASLWGERGGLVTLVLGAFCPHLLAHGSLATSDLAAALGFTAALLAWWRLLHRVTPARLAAAALATTFLSLSKYSAVLLAPIVVALAALRLAQRADLPAAIGSRGWHFRGATRAAALGGAIVVVALVTWLGIWAGYGFRYSAAPDGSEAHFAMPWSEVLIEQARRSGSVMADGATARDEVQLRAGIVQHAVHWGRDHRVLPEAYLYGLAFVDRFSRHRLAYFSGEFRERGWVEFFPAAFLLKTTLPALVLVVLAWLAWVRHGRRRRVAYRLAPLAVLAVVYWVAAIFSHLNIGHRHLLPLYPLLYVFCGAVAGLAVQRWGAVALVLLAWQIADSVAVRPHYLTFFNALAGGPSGGHRFLVDSSLDWGQNLPDLRRWLAANAGDARVYLSYFGSDEPARLGIHATRIGDGYFDHAPSRPVLPALEPGLYCISATMLHRVYTSVRGPWSDGYETEYRRLTRWLVEQQTKPGAEWQGPDARPLGDLERKLELARLEQLRFGRLCRYLERRAPDAIVANTVLIYRLSASEIQAALAAPGSSQLTIDDRETAAADRSLARE